ACSHTWIATLQSRANVLGQVHRAAAALRRRYHEVRDLRLVAGAQGGVDAASAAGAQGGGGKTDLGICSLEIMLDLQRHRVGGLERRGGWHGERQVDLALIAARKEVEANEAEDQHRQT